MKQQKCCSSISRIRSCNKTDYYNSSDSCDYITNKSHSYNRITVAVLRNAVEKAICLLLTDANCIVEIT